MDGNESASFEARAAALVVTASRKISPAAARHEPSPGKQMKLPITPFSRNFGNKACADSLVGPQLIFGRLLDMIDDDYVIGELCRSHL